jgi:hypothetical protein
VKKIKDASIDELEKVVGRKKAEQLVSLKQGASENETGA